ncbi:MAG: hypothetical protein M3P43_10375 [Actinomycetota bacterium]|nr:hypothetical protein [Actinomycetota bacterium]
MPSAKTGRPMILDAKPKKGVVLRDTFNDEWADLRLGDDHPTYVEDQVRASVVDVYTDHHATCPNVDEFRKERARV